MTDKFPDHIIVNVNGQQKSVLMSFGLIHELMKIVSDVTDVQMLLLDPKMQETALGVVFAERNERGEETRRPSLHELNLSVADATKVLKWVAAHVLDFFLTGIEASVETLKPQEARLTGLMPSGDGSPA
jgi:hypothetical protein